MPFPPAVKSHHTAWVRTPGGRPHPVRYAVDGERLVCFADDGLAAVADGARVTMGIHEIAGGPLLAEFSASLHRLTPDQIDLNALAELLAHIPLGRTLAEVNARLDVQRAHRRVVELVA